MKKLVIYLALIVVLSLSFVVPCFAATSVDGDTIIWDGDLGDNSISASYTDVGFSDSSKIYFVKISDETIPTSLLVGNNVSFVTTYSTGSVVSTDGPTVIDSASGNTDCAYFGLIFVCYEDNHTYISPEFTVTFPTSGIYFGRMFGTLTDDGSSVSAFTSSATVPGYTWKQIVPPPTGVYWDIFALLHTYVYGGVELTPDISLTLTLVSTICCLLCVALPFLLVFWVIKRWL